MQYINNVTFKTVQNALLDLVSQKILFWRSLFLYVVSCNRASKYTTVLQNSNLKTASMHLCNNYFAYASHLGLCLTRHNKTTYAALNSLPPICKYSQVQRTWVELLPPLHTWEGSRWMRPQSHKKEKLTFTSSEAASEAGSAVSELSVGHLSQILVLIQLFCCVVFIIGLARFTLTLLGSL